MMKFFDCNCSVGEIENPFPGRRGDLDTLIQNMETYDIDRALVWHMDCVISHPKIGNKKISDICAMYNHLYPVWVVMPNHTGEFYDPQRLQELIILHNVRAVKLCPSDQRLNHSLGIWCCDMIYNLMKNIGIPVFISLNETDCDTVYNICATYPEMNIVLTDIHYSNSRNIFALLANVRNLYTDISYLKTPFILEDLCLKFGSEKLLFGTGLPDMEPGCAISAVLNARLSQNEKENIAYANLDRLLEYKK